MDISLGTHILIFVVLFLCLRVVGMSLCGDIHACLCARGGYRLTVSDF